MTYPITPVPAFHHDPTLRFDNAAALKAATASLRSVMADLPARLIQGLVNAILIALGLGSFEGTIDEMLSQVQTALQNIPKVNIVGLIAALADAIDQELRDAIANALGHTGTGHLASDIQTFLGSIPGSVINGITAIEQETRDKLANALGHSGTGHTAADILSYFGAIPGSVISGITTVEQETRDKIANALGHSGTGHTAADILSYLGAIPGSVISGITTTEQAALDAIANALGHSGTGHTTANIQTYLAAIPGSVISGITTIEQNALDAIANALGHSGTGHTTTDIQTYLGAIPGSNLAGTIAASLISGTTVIEQAILDAISNALGHTGTGHTASQVQGYLAAIPASVVSGVTTTEQAIADAVYQAIHGGSTTGNAISTIKAALTAIPGPNISSITTTEQSIVDGVHNAINNLSTSGNAASTIATNVGHLITGLFNHLTGSSAAAASYTDVNTAATNQVGNIIANGAAIATLQQPNPILGLQNASVSFGSYADSATLASIFTTGAWLTNAVGSASAWGTSAGQAVMPGTGTGNSGQYAKYNVSATATDYQIVSGIFTGTGAVNNYLIGRANSAFTTCVMFIFNTSGGSNNATITAQVSGGGGATLWHDTLPVIPNATYSLVCGTLLGTRYFQILINGVAQNIGTGGANYIQDTSAVSQVGSSFRNTGFAGWLPTANVATMAPMSFWGMQDQVFPAGPPVTVFNATAGTTASTSYTGTLTGRSALSVAVTIGSSGMALVSHTANISNSGAGSTWASWAASGANTIAATDRYALENKGTSPVQMSKFDVVTGLAPGVTTFAQQYNAASTTGSFSNCSISVIPI